MEASSAARSDGFIMVSMFYLPVSRASFSEYAEHFACVCRLSLAHKPRKKRMRDLSSAISVSKDGVESLLREASPLLRSSLSAAQRVD